MRRLSLLLVVFLLVPLGAAAQLSSTPGSRPRAGITGELRTVGPSGTFAVLPPTTQANLPPRCEPGRMYEVLDASVPCGLQRCDPSGSAYLCAGEGAGTPPTTGVRTSPTTLQTVRPEVTTLVGTQTLGLVHTLCANVTDEAASFTLPSWADVTMPGHIEIDICDAGTNSLTVSPHGSDTINWVAAPMTAISGRGSGISCKRRDTNNWKCTTDAPVAIADLGGETVVCKGVGGDTNNSSSGSGTFVSHSLQCPIPANTLRTGTYLQACSLFQFTTGSAAPQLQVVLYANSIQLTQQASNITPTNDVTNDSAAVCFMLGLDGATSTLSAYTAPSTDVEGFGTSALRNSLTQPITLDGTVLQTLIFKTKWFSAGTGTNTIKQEVLFVKMHRQ